MVLSPTLSLLHSKPSGGLQPVTNGTSSFPSSGLLAFWKLADLTDASGNGNTLTNNGSATFVSGKIGNAVQLVKTGDHSGQFLSNNGFLASIPASGTFATWIYADTDHTGVIMSLYAGSGGGVQIYVTSGSVIGDIRGEPSLSASYSPETWTHVALSWSGGASKLYINGALENDNTYSSITNPPSTQFIIGGNCDGGFGRFVFNGKIDAAGVWDVALTESNISQLYNNGNGMEL